MLKYRYILAFGSNLGDLNANAERALQLLSSHGDCLRLSPKIMTKPLSSNEFTTKDHGNFLNFMTEHRSCLDPHALYQAIVQIEDQLGHSRFRRWAPRAIDIDILLAAFDDHESFKHCSPLLINEPMPGLSIPHKDFLKRDFWQSLITKLEKTPEISEAKKSIS